MIEAIIGVVAVVVIAVAGVHKVLKKFGGS